MRVLGECCLLLCLVATGYAAVLSLLGGRSLDRGQSRLAMWAALVGFAALSVTFVVLAWALASGDFSYQYVANYSSHLLPWRYRLSALWVGQAGSLLLWAWMMGALALALRFLRTVDPLLRRTAFGLVMGNVCFLVAVMVFAADPMAASLTAPHEGLGLSPLLQHPNMLIHPPIVFLAYATWSVPCALALAALGHGRLDATWTQHRATVGHGGLGAAGRRAVARCAVGISGTWLGRILGLGSGGERVPVAVAHRHRADPQHAGLAAS